MTGPLWLGLSAFAARVFSHPTKALVSSPVLDDSVHLGPLPGWDATCSPELRQAPARPRAAA